MSYRKPKYIALRMALVFVMTGIFVWSYILFWQNFDRIHLSEKMVEAILENKTELARKYAQELGLANINLERTEAFLRDVQTENLQLKEKIKLLDQLNDLEREIGSLREENARIQEFVRDSGGKITQAQVKDDFDFDSIDNGRSLLQQLRQKIAGVKNRISFLKKKEKEYKIAVQREVDEKKMELGNNGYLVKDGKPMPVNLPDEKHLSDGVKVKVEFVK